MVGVVRGIREEGVLGANLLHLGWSSSLGGELIRHLDVVPHNTVHLATECVMMTD